MSEIILSFPLKRDDNIKTINNEKLSCVSLDNEKWDIFIIQIDWLFLNPESS